MSGLPTGNKSLRGFTLVEVLMAITLLAAGALLALPALQRSSDHLRYLYQRADAENVLNNLIVDAEFRFKADRSLRALPLEGEVVENGTPFRYRIETLPVNQAGSLVELRTTVNWMGEGTAGLSRSAYVAN